MATVRLENVDKVFPGDVRAVDDVSLDIKDGEFVVLVGPSGCGKSTTLRIIAGLETMSAGTLSIDDRVVNDVPARDRDIAMVFQNYALYPHLTVQQNLSFGIDRRRRHRSRLRALMSKTYATARRAELEEVQTRVLDAAKTLELDVLLARYPRELSGGQRQRVAVGRALVRDPKVFLFDEPLSNLDAKLRKEMRLELRSLHRRLKATMVYVTHDQEEAMTLGDRLVVMNEGQLQQVGPPIDVYEQPANRFVAGFIGSPPMSFIAGRIESGRFVDSTGVTIPLANELADLADQPVQLGIRPSDVRPSSDGPFEGRVEMMERYGDGVDIRVDSDHTSLLARVSTAPGIREGDTIRLSLETARIHLFEPGPSGNRLNPERG